MEKIKLNFYPNNKIIVFYNYNELYNLIIKINYLFLINNLI